MTSPQRRADAIENRARIIRAARSVIATSNELKLNAIAKQAGVGQGTLYRHFPTREDLLAEVYRQDVDELVAAAPALLEAHAPLDALARWFDRVADYAQVKRGVFAAVEAALWQDLSAHSLGPIGDALTTLLTAGKADSTIRDDVDAHDVILLISYLSRVNDTDSDARTRHPLDIILDGLRNHDHPASADRETLHAPAVPKHKMSEDVPGPWVNDRGLNGDRPSADREHATPGVTRRDRTGTSWTSPDVLRTS